MGFDLRQYMEEHELPAESEQFRSNIWQALEKVRLNEAGLTLGEVHALLWKSDKDAAKQLSHSMSEYCFHVAMSTSGHFDCSKQLFNEGPADLWQSIYYAVQNDAVKALPEFKEWDMPVSTSHAFQADLKTAVAAKCQQYGLTLDAMRTGREVK